MKKWIITILLVFACLPVAVVKAASPQTYIHLDYEIITNGYYDVGDGNFVDSPYWRRSNQIQIPKNVDKLYFSKWATHFILFFEYYQDTMDYVLIGYYHDNDHVMDLTWTTGWADFKLGEYEYYNDLIHTLDVPTNATHLVLQTCDNISAAGLTGYLDTFSSPFGVLDKPLIYYPAPADAATNMTFGLMPALMIMIVIAGLVGGLIMITKKSR